MKRTWAGAALLIALSIWAAAGRRSADPEASIERARRLLEDRFAGWRSRVEAAARRMRELAKEQDPIALFAGAEKILEEQQVHGVAILDWNNRARGWAGRTFQLEPEFDLYRVKLGVEAIEVLEHPAHRVLIAALPAGKEIAVAFFAFDETFPHRHDLGAEVAKEAGLASIRLRYNQTVPVGEKPSDHVSRATVIAGELAHATFHAKPAKVLADEAAARFRFRLRVVALLALLLSGVVLWKRLRPRLAAHPLGLVWAGAALFCAGRLALGLLALPPWPPFGGTLWTAPGDVTLTAVAALLVAIALARTSREEFGRHATEGLFAVMLGAALLAPRLYISGLRALVRRPDEVEIFDPLRVLPDRNAALLLVSICLATVALFLVVLAAGRVGRRLWRPAAPVPYLVAALSVWGWQGALLAVGCALAALVLRRAATRPERAAALAFLTAVISAPLLYATQREEFTRDVADRARAMVDGSWRQRAEARLLRAVERATDPMIGAHSAVADALARGDDPKYLKHLAFQLWAATDWSPTDPCAVQIWNRDGELVSSFDFDSPPQGLLPTAPDPQSWREGLSMDRGQGEGEAIHFYIYTMVLRTIGDNEPRGIARIILPDHWDVLIANLRPAMFSSPLDALGPSTPRPLVLAELGTDGKPTRSSDGTTADLARPDPQVLAEALERGYASGPVVYRGQDARMVLTGAIGGARYRLGALVFRESLLQQGGLAFAKILLTNSAVCLLYVALLFLSRKGPVVFLFRHRVALFLAVVSVAPVLMLAIYNKRIASQRYEGEIAERLQRRLELAEALLRKAPVPVTSEWCTGFAADFRMDLNVYRGQELFATSRPGIWDTGLLARRLAAEPYLALYIEDRTDITGHEFFTRESGLRAAYRKVRRSPDRPDLIIAAPALEDRRDLERRAAESNALLLAIYLTTALVAVFVALYLARSLTEPVRALREATRRVAAGELKETLTEERADEFGDLVRAFNDMTRQIRETQDLRVRVEKAAAWREMARQIAHEIKNPLTPIKLTVQNMLADFGEDEAAFREDFEAGAKLILEQIEALQRIAGEFSAYARFPLREPEPVDISALADEVAALFAVHAEICDEELLVEGDRDELRRALINLVTNSKQAGASSVLMRTARREGLAVVSVHDDGTGISTMDIERLFDPSFTTKSSGTGLGMPIVKRVVDDHGGTIAINSTPGSGTSVIIRLPLLEPKKT